MSLWDDVAVDAPQVACHTLSVDLISVEPATFRGFMLNRKLAGLTARRGVALELVYAPALSAGSVRRQMLLAALTLTNIANGQVAARDAKGRMVCPAPAEHRGRLGAAVSLITRVRFCHSFCV